MFRTFLDGQPPVGSDIGRTSDRHFPKVAPLEGMVPPERMRHAFLEYCSFESMVLSSSNIFFNLALSALRFSPLSVSVFFFITAVATSSCNLLSSAIPPQDSTSFVTLVCSRKNWKQGNNYHIHCATRQTDAALAAPKNNAVCDLCNYCDLLRSMIIVIYYARTKLKKKKNTQKN